MRDVQKISPKTKKWLIGFFTILVIIVTSFRATSEYNSMQPVDHWLYRPTTSVKLNNNDQIVIILSGRNDNVCRKGEYLFDLIYDDDTLIIDVKGIRYFGDNYLRDVGGIDICFFPGPLIVNEIFLDKGWIDNGGERELVVRGDEGYQDTFELLVDNENAKANLIWTTRFFNKKDYPEPYELPKLKDFPVVSLNTNANNDLVMRLSYSDHEVCREGEIFSIDNKHYQENKLIIDVKGLMYTGKKENCTTPRTIHKDVILDKTDFEKGDLQVILSLEVQHDQLIKKVYKIEKDSYGKPQIKTFTQYPISRLSSSIHTETDSPFIDIVAQSEYCVHGDIGYNISVHNMFLTLYINYVESHTDKDITLDRTCPDLKLQERIYLPKSWFNEHHPIHNLTVRVMNTGNSPVFNKHKLETEYELKKLDQSSDYYSIFP